MGAIYIIAEFNVLSILHGLSIKLSEPGVGCASGSGWKCVYKGEEEKGKVKKRRNVYIELLLVFIMGRGEWVSGVPVQSWDLKCRLESPTNHFLLKPWSALFFKAIIFSIKPCMFKLWITSLNLSGSDCLFCSAILKVAINRCVTRNLLALGVKRYCLISVIFLNVFRIPITLKIFFSCFFQLCLWGIVHWFQKKH